jgi:MFS family permease
VGDKLGRKKTIALGLICNAVGAILQIVSWHLPQMIVGRIINGFGMGKSIFKFMNLYPVIPSFIDTSLHQALRPQPALFIKLSAPSQAFAENWSLSARSATLLHSAWPIG